jgi:hypothetical protein
MIKIINVQQYQVIFAQSLDAEVEEEIGNDKRKITKNAEVDGT